MLAALMAAGLALALTALPAPASAQTGGVSGKIVDEAGKPIADVDVVLNNPEGSLAPVKLKTNAKGEYQAIGIRSGNYQIKATKGDLSILSPVIHVGMGGMMELPLLHLKKGGGGGAVSEDEAKKQAAIAAAFKSAQAAADAGNFDDAVTQFTKLATDVPKCTLCYVQIGRALARRGHPEPRPPSSRPSMPTRRSRTVILSSASFYNAQKKFDEANQARKPPN